MRWTIRTKLYAMVVVLAVLLGGLGAITYERFGRTAQIEDELNQAHRIENLSALMNEALLEARRREKDFLLREGDAKYRDMVVKAGERFLKDASELRATAGRLQHVDQRQTAGLGAIEEGMKDYLATFDKAATVFHEKGLPETGAQGRMRKAAHDLERSFQDFEEQGSQVLLLQLRRAEKDFLLRGDLKYQETLRGYATKLEGQLGERGENAEARRLAKENLAAYVESFDAVVAADRRMATLLAELHQVHSGIEPKLDELGQTALRHSDELGAEVLAVRQQALSTLFIAFACVLLLGAAAVTWVSRQIGAGVAQLIDGTKRVATGDLTTNVDVRSNDELGQLGESFNQMIDGLRDMSSRINETSKTLSVVANELNATVTEQSAALQQQAAAVTETVSTIEEMTRSASSVADTAQNVSTGAVNSVETSTRGESALKQSVEGMLSIRDQVQNIASTILELSEKTQQIGGIIATVDDFAEQSSLLALNASIEAARAGEQGKAFSVVAAEVKKLAEQSQQATDKVRNILGEIQRATHSAVMVTEEGSKRVDRGVGLIETAGQIVAELVETIKGSSRFAKQIAAASQQQASGIEQVSSAMTGIDQSSRQNLAAVKQTEAASQTLADVTQELSKTTARYRLA
ncbi:MAG TPA: methyl-accepting chemotaxis protein [Polyangiaceae bacterium]|nr:methyl-accepting chemotaxis protein [Polyangiaceae bacterium]